eukprot:CAMPEP_0119150092 /NCGR_PEP_ID=MMETSP1310-20130426/44283_1 /TAXON_ID=464262 /ORGANISM="Genus nov. species nov., Strain RCC2339" /LENGTH=36 /DNA_ID= /DNA_START= /DNA_END= /DNA_ORIENTATION=
MVKRIFSYGKTISGVETVAAQAMVQRNTASLAVKQV